MSRKGERSIWIIFLIIVMLVLPALLLSGCDFDDSADFVGATISADGSTAYRVTSQSSTKITSPVVYLNVIDLAQNEIINYYKLPASFFQHAYIFTQGSDTLLVVPQYAESGQPSLCNVYLCNPDRPPELISGNNFYLASPLSEPYVWHSSTVLLGRDQSGGHALMYIQGGKIDVFPLDAVEEFATGINSVSFHSIWGYFDDLNFFVLEVRLYDNREFYVSPFLTDEGVPIIELVSGDSFGGEDTVLSIAQRYYGENNILVVRKQSDSTSDLALVPVIENSSMKAAGTPVETETLYRAVCLGLDDSTQLVLGYTGANPEHSPVLGYIYDIKSGALTQLPVFSNVSLADIISAIHASPDLLVLRVKHSQSSEDAFIVRFPDGAPYFASSAEISEPPTIRFLKLTDSFEFRLLVIIFGSIILIFIIISILKSKSNRKRRKALGAETQQKEKVSVTRVFRSLMLIAGLLLILSTFPVSFFFKPSLALLPAGLPILGAVLIITSSFLAAANRRKVKNGQLVFGTVTSIRPTGMTVNDQPQVELLMQFSTLDGKEITASTRRIVPVTQLPQFQPGATLPLRYDPENPHKIMLDRSSSQDELQAAYNRHSISIGLSTQEKVDIAENGIKAQGVVLSSQPTGNIVNGWGEMTLNIRVTRPNNGGSFDAVVHKAIPPQMLSNVLPGAVLDIYYMPGNEKNIAIAMSMV